MADPVERSMLGRRLDLPVGNGNVSFSGPPLSTACQPYDPGRDVLSAVAHFHTSGGRAYLVIIPSALPTGIGVSIFDKPGTGVPSPNLQTPTHGKGSGIKAPPAEITGPLAIGLIYASQQCTG